MKLIILFLCIFASEQLLAEQCCLQPKPTSVVVYKTIKTESKPCCDKQQVNSTSESKAGVKAATGNQTITINMPQPKQVVYRTHYRDRKVIEKIEVFKPNRLQLLLGLSKTRLEIENDSCCNYYAKKTYQPDIGLQYLRDIGDFTGSIAATINQSFYFGLGFNW